MNTAVGGKQHEDITNIFKALDTMKQIKLVFCDFGQLSVLITSLNVCATAAFNPCKLNKETIQGIFDVAWYLNGNQQLVIKTSI